MTVYRVKPRRKSGENVLDNLIFLTDASAVDLTGFTRFTDQELTGVIPDVSEDMNASEAFKTLDAQVRKAVKAIPDLNTLATVAKTGDYGDLLNTPVIPSKLSQLSNDSGYLTAVTWEGVTGKPTQFTPTSHTQSSSTINSLTGYVIASSSSAITATDSLNAALGKLEYKVNSKLDANATAKAAEKLSNSRSVTISGAVSGSGSFDGSADLSISTTLNNIDASKITSGVFSLARIPKSAISYLKKVPTLEAMYALTTNDIQIGDSVKVTGTGQLYYVIDDTKLNSAEGYEVYTADTAASVPWSGITNKPSTFTPAAHTHVASDVSGLASVATSGSYADLSNKPTIPSKVSQLTNDSGYLTSVTWEGINNKPTAFTPASHNQASNSITALTGYTKPSTTSALLATDTLNVALGKLEYGLGTKLDANATAVKATADAAGNTISTTYIKSVTISGKTVTITKGDGSTETQTTQDTTYTSMTGATQNAAGKSGLVPAPSAGDQLKFLRGDGTWVVPTDTDTKYTGSNGVALDSTGTNFVNTGVRAVTAGSTANVIKVNTNGTETSITINNVANATSATSDASGNNIAATYAKKTDVPTVWDSDGHLVSPAGWTFWVTDT